MRLSKNNHKALYGSSKSIESLCSSCIYNGSTTCPSKRSSYVSKDRYPHVKDYVINGLFLHVTECDGYYKKSPMVKKNKKPEYVWDSKERKFVKKA